MTQADVLTCAAIPTFVLTLTLAFTSGSGLVAPAREGSAQVPEGEAASLPALLEAPGVRVRLRRLVSENGEVTSHVWNFVSLGESSSSGRVQVCVCVCVCACVCVCVRVRVCVCVCVFLCARV